MARGRRGRSRQSQSTRLHLNSNSPAEDFPEASAAPPPRQMKSQKQRRPDHCWRPLPRVLMDMKLEGSFPGFVEFFNEEAVLIRQVIKYEWLPIKCLHCRMFGHVKDQCRKKSRTRMEWRKGQSSSAEDEFIPISRKAASPRTWSIRGLNWPNKQVDVNIFLHLNKVGLIGMFKTKVKEKNAEKVVAKVFPGWRWIQNFHLDPRDSYELQELRSIGAYYSWTNKSVWGRIDRALTNVYWSDVFNFTQVRYNTNSLSNHTPLLIQFPQSPKAKTKFQYCDMWANHENFHTIITVALPSPSSTLNLLHLKRFLDQIRPHLLSLNRSSFKDMRNTDRTSSPSQRYGIFVFYSSNVNKNGSSMEIHALDFSLQKQNRGNWLPISTPSKMLRVHGLRDLTMWVRLTQISRKHLWSGTEDFKRPPTSPGETHIYLKIMEDWALKTSLLGIGL
ncbi:hypothetical protein Cgig2_015705 [Carnegiea gigantea]|uniref:DUF4283 domain-containing protein n=1 Tax=Carnegiea gigantea TaxID=171969 RepID=A0A9Q1GQR0_9CARY|nr:hypothetical protein Cgig2_015705 [Carnegiea gigantea]